MGIAPGRSTRSLAGMPRHHGKLTTPLGGDVREELCVVLCGRIAAGVSPQDSAAIRDTLNDAETDGWWFLNSGTIIAAFVSRHFGAERAAECERALMQLAASHPSLAEIEVGVAEGRVIGSFTNAGIIETMSVGVVVADAVKRAMHAS